MLDAVWCAFFHCDGGKRVTPASNATAIIFIAVVFNIISICSREMIDERVDAWPTFWPRSAKIFQQWQHKSNYRWVKIDNHGDVVGGEEEE